MAEFYEHDYDDYGVCSKCHQHRRVHKTNACPVIGEEEVAQFKDVGND